MVSSGLDRLKPRRAAGWSGGFDRRNSTRRTGRLGGFSQGISGRKKRQDCLSCAPWCAALSLGTILIRRICGRCQNPQEKVPPDDQHLAELSSACRFYRGGGGDRPSAPD